MRYLPQAALPHLRQARRFTAQYLMKNAVLKRFFKINELISDKIEDLLPASFTRSLLYRHEHTVARIMDTHASRYVIDVGGGHLCPFAKHRNPAADTAIVAVDILESQVKRNVDVDHGLVSDVCLSLPLKASSVDVIVTRSVLEHLKDNSVFLKECYRTLRSEGRCVHVFPCKFSPFSLINQLLPEKLAQNILYYFFPKWKDACGFQAYYADCYYPAMIKKLKSVGFDIEDIHFRYYQSIYYKFFVPLYLVFVVYDLLLWALDLRLLCAQILLVAKKVA
jgi:SAM-dependent methyltransferase